MYLAYVDESGDSGPKGSKSFSLGCLLIEDQVWPDVLDNTIDFRRFLRTRFGIPVRAELKANFLLSNKGPFRPLHLSEQARFSVYRSCMRLLPKLDVRAFAIVIRKDVMATRGRSEDPRHVAWEYLIQRLERFTTKGGTHLTLIHDEGYAAEVRKLARKSRRIGTAGSMFGTGSLRRPARLILDDPVSRRSNESYFLQFADLAAYAAFRAIYPPPVRPVQIVPQGMWDELGAARYAPVNMYSG